MAKIFSPPDTIKIPELSFEDIKDYEKACKEYVEDLKQWCIRRAENGGADTQYIGEVIRFPVADGYAEYMVAAFKPIQLIHIPLWDAWEFDYANRLTKKDIIDKINQQNSLKKLFGGE